MQSSSDAQAVSSFLERIARRRDVIAILEGVAGGLVLAAVVAIVMLSQQASAAYASWVTALLVSVGAAGRLLYIRFRQPSAAQLVESRVPACANILCTASELLAEPGVARVEGQSRLSAPLTASPRIGSLVLQEAAQRVSGIAPAALIPSKWAALALATSAIVWALIIARDVSPVRAVRAAVQNVIAPNVARIDGIAITVTPPAYTGRESVTLSDSSRIEVLSGSSISIEVRGNADSLRVETLSDVQSIAPVSGKQFLFSMTASANGFVALQPVLNGGNQGARRLISVTMREDEAPRVRITQPARDTRLISPDTQLNISVTAEDDIALSSLRLRYTRVSGSGERFTFDDGEIPISITRVSAGQWTGEAQWSLSPLKLEPGDLVVYRAVTTDNRPGSPPQESDALIAEMQTIGGEAAAGFDMDEEFERYAVSQAMVVLKTERLIAAMGGMSRDSIAAAAQSLSVEQRKVRAEFVFMMGGELEDEHGHEGDLDDLGEEAEAEAEGDILAGRLENQGRIALMRAVRAMSRASTALNAVEVSLALVSEKQALSNIQLAFSRSRILLRALSQRESLDLTRRLSGDLSDARSVLRPTVLAEVDSQTVALQRLLSRVATLAGASEVESSVVGSSTPMQSVASEFSALAQELLQQDASSDVIREVAARLSDASATALRGDLAASRATAEQAALALASLLREQLPTPSRAKPPATRNRLDGALADVLRQQRGQGGERGGPGERGQRQVPDQR